MVAGRLLNLILALNIIPINETKTRGFISELGIVTLIVLLTVSRKQKQL